MTGIRPSAPVFDNPLPKMTVGECIPAPFEETRDGHRRRREAGARARDYEATGSWHYPGEALRPALPPLDLVTGRSKADPDKPPHHPDRPLFGGWRLDDWEKKRGKG